jgi:hypothetical protein
VSRRIYISIPLIWLRISKIILSIKSSLDFILFSSQTLTRVTYTINLNGTGLSSLTVTPPLFNTILLSDIYTDVPYKKFMIYIDGTNINLTSPSILAMINQALRTSWTLMNSNLFSPNDLLIPSINPVASE